MEVRPQMVVTMNLQETSWMVAALIAAMMHCELDEQVSAFVERLLEDIGVEREGDDGPDENDLIH